MNIAKKKTAVVTGAAGRLGSVFARTLAQDGWRVLLADTNLEAADKIATAIRNDGFDASAVTIDITNKSSMQSILKTEQISLLVNNAYPRNKNFNRSFFDVEYADLCENLSLHLG